MKSNLIEVIEEQGEITPKEYAIIYETKHPIGDEAEQTTPMP